MFHKIKGTLAISWLKNEIRIFSTGREINIEEYFFFYDRVSIYTSFIYKSVVIS